MSNIPVAGVERTASHPAWTPVSVDGSVITGAMVGDDQAFGIGTADKAVGGNTFKGDSGQMITISGYNTADTIEDHTGDGDDAVQMRSLDLEVPGTRQLSCIVPAGWEWVPKMLQTIFRTTPRAPDDHHRHLRHRGLGQSQQFLIGVAEPPHRGQGRAEDRSRPDAVRARRPRRASRNGLGSAHAERHAPGQALSELAGGVRSSRAAISEAVRSSASRRRGRCGRWSAWSTQELCVP